ncbi:ABC transporter permease [Lacrimispora sp. 38-1]|uniref:ABC transporter permease n=1 Tax=Lacrimispora sp. 38-1 TaxID=3125778 RepID=UPI003CF49846
MKLALRNMKRSIGNYLSYFLTIMIAITLMYSFTALASSKDIISLSDTMPVFKKYIIILTFITSAMIAFVISYASDFMIDQRKKEFAVYKVMGMEQKIINRLFCIENMLLFLMAMSIGIALGAVFAGGLTAYVMKIFHTSHRYGVNLSGFPVIYTVVFGMIIQLISAIRIIYNLNHKKIIDLIYDSQKNERASIRYNLKRRVLSFIALILYPIGMWLVWYGLTCSSRSAWIYLGTATICILFSVILIYRYFPIMITSVFNKAEKWKLRGTNLFLLKQFSSRINSTGKILAVVAVLLTLAMSVIAGGLFMGASYTVNIEDYAPYDIAIKIDADIDNFEKELTYIEKQVPVTDYVDYKLYETAQIPDMPILAISDYNHIRKQLDLKPVELGDKEYAVHCEPGYEKEMLAGMKEKPAVKIADQGLFPADTPLHTETIEQYWMAGDKGYAMVVPDWLADGLPTHKSRLIVSTYPAAPKEIKKELYSVISDHLEPYITKGFLSEHTEIGVLVKTWTVANSLTGYTIISFCCLYMGIIFLILVGSLLAFQQMAAAEKNNKKYIMLYKVGVSWQQINLLALKEMLLFFITPVIVPLLVTFSLAGILNSILKDRVYAVNIILRYTGVAVTVFMMIYIFYFIITFITYRRVALRHCPKAKGKDRKK